MKNRFCKMGHTLLGAVCLLSTCGLVYSCSDDYDLPDTRPGFLGESIYDELKARGNFNTTIRLIDDLEYADVLAKTGSKTLFVAADTCYDKFFLSGYFKDGNGNPVTSYDQLSTNQKRVLLYNSMLDNAYVMEMLANTENGGKNDCFRQISSATAIDSVTWWNYSDLPTNKNQDAEGVTHEIKFWSNYNTPRNGQGIYMVLDNTRPMMTHFLEGPMKERDITNEDIAFILTGDATNWPNGSGARSYVYGNRVVEEDVTCLNGYFHVMDNVLLTPPNMAEVIRQNDNTKLFSHMLERFSAPFYDADLTANYRALHPETFAATDSVFQKRYFSQRSQGGDALSTAPDGEPLRTDFPLLSFDPGWNEYATSDTEEKETDMGVMFAPTDDAIRSYFLSGQGLTLLENYNPGKDIEVAKGNDEVLTEYLDQIPLDIVKALINNFMKASFCESVPSKYMTIMNDARDPMFSSYASETAYKSLIEKTLLANNGVVYVIKSVISPADYAAVSSPVLQSRNTQVMKTILTADDNYVTGTSFNNAPLQKYYSTLLKAMQSHFVLFVPEDDGFKSHGYVDPASVASGSVAMRRAFTFVYEDVSTTASGKFLPIYARAYSYNDDDGTDLNSSVSGDSAPNDPVGSSNSTGGVKASLLTQMVDQHIVVLDSIGLYGMGTNKIVNGYGGSSYPRYYLSRSGAPVYVRTLATDDDGAGMQVEGGLQVDLAKDDRGAYYTSTVKQGYNMSGIDANGDYSYGNGMTYMLDRPMQPSMKSVYSRMSNNENMADFFELCTGWDRDLLKQCGFSLVFADDDPNKEGEPTDVMSDADWRSERNKYRIFINTESWSSGSSTVSNGYYPATDEALVRFFNNYNYTVYVPSNSAVQKAIANGLPTWENIREFVESHEQYGSSDGSFSGILKNKEDRDMAQAMVIELVNFLKYHFQDKSLFVDHVDHAAESDYQTSCIDNDENIYLSLSVTKSDEALNITDRAGRGVKVSGENVNIFATDINFAQNPANRNTTIKTSSYVVLHQINDDNYLDFRSNGSGASFAAEYSTPAKAKAFVKRYRIRK